VNTFNVNINFKKIIPGQQLECKSHVLSTAKPLQGLGVKRKTKQYSLKWSYCTALPQ
jgi:hypothetical protein